MRRASVLFVLAACGGGAGGRHDHAPVDPELTLAVVVPGNMKRVTAGAVHVERWTPGFDANAWQADLREHNQSFDVPPPTPLGDGLAVVVRPKGGSGEVNAWYRSLGSIGLQCLGLVPANTRITRAGCFGTQVLADGIYVPFALEDPIGTSVQVAIVDEPLSTTAYVTIDPERMRMIEDIHRNLKVVARGTLGDGRWVITLDDRRGRDHYEATVRRTINGVELMCTADNYGSEEQTRRGMATCLALEATGNRPPTAPAIDAAPPPIDAAPTVDAMTALTGPASGEAMARAFVEAVAAADEPGMRALLITPEIQRTFYRCDNHPGYSMDDRAREAMAEAMQPLELGRRMAGYGGRIEIGGWTETYRKRYAVNDDVTFICRTNRELDVVMGDLALTVIDSRRRRRMTASFVVVETMGSARISEASIE